MASADLEVFYLPHTKGSTQRVNDSNVAVLHKAETRDSRVRQWYGDVTEHRHLAWPLQRELNTQPHLLC